LSQVGEAVTPVTVARTGARLSGRFQVTLQRPVEPVTQDRVEVDPALSTRRNVTVALATALPFWLLRIRTRAMAL
jgi:hypothetical protein